jgi:hypothetical protein
VALNIGRITSYLVGPRLVLDLPLSYREQLVRLTSLPAILHDRFCLSDAAFFLASTPS